MPLISIIIPVLNRASLVCSTLDAVIKQEFKDFEVILVDDGSTDDIKNKLSGYIDEGSIKYYYQSNAGVSEARNKGASISEGQYLIFLDSDDSVTENWLLDYANMIKKSNPDIIYCGINRLKENILVEYTDPKNPYKDGKSFGNVIPGSFCIKSELFKTIGGYDDKLAYGENTELGFRIKMANPITTFISSPNLNYNMHENSHGKNERNKMNGLIYTINKHPQLFNDNKEMKRRFLSIAGVAAVHCNEFKIARGLFFKAWKIKFFSSTNFLRFIISCFPMFGKIIWANK
jgi:glycosyltransferase involved in cell wall biosynthesis